MLFQSEESDVISVQNKIKSQQNTLLCSMAWFPLNRNRIVKSCDPSRFWLIAERLIAIENKNFTEIGSDLQPKRILS